MKYKPGDEVLVKGAITDLHEGTDHPYFVAVNYDSVHWVSEDKIIPMDKTYADGLSDAWELAKKIVLDGDRGGFSCSELESIFDTVYPSDILEELSYKEALSKIETYEKGKLIKVGDVVKGISTDGIVTRLSDDDTFYVMWKDGSSGRHNINDLKKTGKHIDIESLLRQIGE